jgi:hypothetical protein
MGMTNMAEITKIGGVVAVGGLIVEGVEAIDTDNQNENSENKAHQHGLIEGAEHLLEGAMALKVIEGVSSKGVKAALKKFGGELEHDGAALAQNAAKFFKAGEDIAMKLAEKIISHF